MRKVIAAAFISLDGVMQAPGGPEEDPVGGFRHGGWVAPLWDDVVGQSIGDSFSQPFELLLGRKTYDIFAAHWPFVDTDPNSPGYSAQDAGIAVAFNRLTKHVATHRPESLSWQNSRALGPDVAAAVRRLKQEDGPALITQGSTELLQLLLANDLVDEFRLIAFPLILGKGKRLFGSGAIPAALRLTKSAVSPGGALIATYERDGDVRTGSFAMPEPTAAELERRRNLT